MFDKQSAQMAAGFSVECKLHQCAGFL